MGTLYAEPLVYATAMHRLLPLLLLAACSSTPDVPPEYRQGVYRPAPPVFNPAQDAPHTVGQPGHLRQPQEYPKSPHKRELPPTKEPGLWAGDGEQASIGIDTERGPVVLGVPLAVFDPPAPANLDEMYARFCATAIDSAILRLGLKTEILGYGGRRACFLAHVYDKCVSDIEQGTAASDAIKGGGDASLRRLILLALKARVVLPWKDAVCGGEKLTKRRTALASTVWSNALESITGDQ
jgi:hypothetical protein